MAITEPLDIVNAACALYGDFPLQDLETDTIEGQPASLLYQSVVEFNLGLYPFSFGKQMFALSRDDLETSLVGYSYVYLLPPERLEAPIFITDDVTSPARRFSDFLISGRHVHSNAIALAAMCKHRPAPWQWSATFRHMTVTALAAELALSRAHDKDLRARLHRDAYGTPTENYRGGLMRAAINADSFGNPHRTQDKFNNPLENARNL